MVKILRIFVKDTKANREAYMCIYFTYDEYSFSNDVDLTYDKDGFIVKEGTVKRKNNINTFVILEI